MYYTYFGLEEPPFNITPDSKFLYESTEHRKALSMLLYGIQERKGFILLTGEIGSGKTTICRALVNRLKNDNVRLAVILNPSLNELELLKAINDEFAIPSFYDTKKGLTDALNHFLLLENQAGHNVCLIIDEAQTLSPVMLEQVRMLSNLETEDSKLLQIVLIGQPELRATLEHPDLEQLNQRIAVRFHMEPLQMKDLAGYIDHRLRVAHAKVQVTFTADALQMAFNQTGGIPRKLNVLCDRALLAAFAVPTTTIDKSVMARAVEEVFGKNRGGGHTGRHRRVGSSASSLPVMRRSMAIAIVVMALFGLIMGSMALGVYIARTQVRQQDQAQANPTSGPDLTDPQQAVDPNGPDGVDSTSTSGPVVAATPSPTPDWESLRQRQPHWKYDDKVTLVRVNDPRVTLRAAQFSVMRAWGFALNLQEAASAGDDLLTAGNFNAPGIHSLEVALEGMDYNRAVRLNVPLVLRTKDRGPNLSEYVVLLQAAGEAVTIGDPVWGAKGLKSSDLIKHWGSATAIGFDVSGLRSLKRGERSATAKELQTFLRAFLRGATDVEVSGVYDAKTTEAIQKFQAYYDLPETGQLDTLTMILLNARMATNGPKLNAGALRG
jgi:general secretion pathway protein A